MCACDRTLKPTAAAQIVHAPVEEMLKLRLARTGVLRCVGLTLPTFAPAGTGAHPCRIRAATALSAASVWLCACVRACVRAWACSNESLLPGTEMGIPIGATGASDVEASKQTNKRSRYHGIPWRRGLLQVFFSLPTQPTRLSVGLTGGNLCVRHRGAHPSLAHARGPQAGQAPGASAAAHVRAGTCPPRTPLPSGAQVHRLRAERERQRRRLLRSAGLRAPQPTAAVL